MVRVFMDMLWRIVQFSFACHVNSFILILGLLLKLYQICHLLGVVDHKCC